MNRSPRLFACLRPFACLGLVSALAPLTALTLLVGCGGSPEPSAKPDASTTTDTVLSDSVPSDSTGADTAQDSATLPSDATGTGGDVGSGSDVAAPGDATTSTDGASGDTTAPDAAADTAPDVSAPTTCASHKDCMVGLVCHKTACDQPGQCLAPPGACAPEPDFECGCDGNTYANVCERVAAGVGLKQKGKCPTIGEPCLPGKADACADGEYCKLAEYGCNAKDVGKCTAKPPFCGGPVQSVCGCNGQNFGSPCLAASAGVNVASEGDCPSPGKMCGGIVGAQCGPGMACDRQECYPDAAGTCIFPPQTCPAPLPDEAECGCDGKTYGSACERQQAGVGFKNAGKCTM